MDTGRRPLWQEETAPRRRMADPVRTAAVRAVIIVAITLIQAMVAFLCTLAGSWLAFPAVLSTVASTVVATWGVLDVWVTRQVWVQRHGVQSQPSSTARELRRERRRARRAAARGTRDDPAPADRAAA
ncbi:membrane protein [Streptomyces chattanoogensis]|uniref:Membrane protein n=2 Tax=Streptomyces chattanoogensis TaxID=66876 RepID=A0A0N1JWJ9_9ACTN|nr:membrane protein [Streptomyces chattanoogensis]